MPQHVQHEIHAVKVKVGGVVLRRAAHDIAFHVVNGFAVSVRMLERHDFLSIRTNLSYSIALYEPSGIAFRTECGRLGKHPVCRCVVDYDGTVVPLGLSKNKARARRGQHNITIPRMTKERVWVK